MKPPLLAALLTISLCAADLTPAQQKLNVDSFEYAWKTIRDKMWDPMPAGVDWKQIHDELLPKVQSAKSMGEARAAMRDMISRLKMTHFNIIPSDVYETVATKAKGDGEPGFDLRILDGEAVVTTVEANSPAAKAGVKPGWRVVSVEGKDLEPVLKKLSETYKETTTRELIMARALLAGLSGPRGSQAKAEFVDGAGKRVPLEVELVAPRGMESKFGHLPTQHVWFESKKVSGSGYIAFNMFMDAGRIAPQFSDSVQSCMGAKPCDGIIIDLRGNPGGLGAMSMGMAGWFVSKPNQRLGVMKTKENELKFMVFPRAETFDGPVVLLTDALTGSTSEIFAGGLKDLGRARVVGTRSAGAALPSMFERLPNGDGFQYAIANYISEGGKPLEGIGVIPDEEVKLTRQALLEGRDPVLEAALAYIRKQKDQK